MLDKSIQNIITHAQSTHNQVAVNSIVMAILRLKNEFLTGIDEQFHEKFFNDAYFTCINNLRALTLDDFFKFGESRDPGLVLEISRDLRGVIENIILKMQEPIMPDFDIVNIYIDGHEERIEVSLKQVFPLVFKALQNDTGFAHAYKGDIDSCIEQAKQDRPSRLYSLFCCLKRVQGICHTGIRNELVGLLNGTYRNIYILEDARISIEFFLKDELQRILAQAIKNVTYENSNRLISKLAAESEMQGDSENRSRAYTSVHGDSSTESAQNLPRQVEFRKISDIDMLKKAILSWIIEDNPLPLLKLSNCKDLIESKIKKIFIDNGSNPETLTIKNDDGVNVLLSEFIPEYTKHLVFQRDLKNQPNLAFVDFILKSDTQVIGQSSRNKALKSMQDWINSDWNILSKEHNLYISGFYAAYQAHVNLQKYQTLLLLTQAYSEQEFLSLEQSLEDYLNRFLSKLAAESKVRGESERRTGVYTSVHEDSSTVSTKQFAAAVEFGKKSNVNLPLTLSAELYKNILHIDECVKQIKNNELEEPLQNFFALWSVALKVQDYKTLSRLYQLILDVNAQRKILLTDNILQIWNNKIITEQSGNFRDISPYEINRIFLHAIIVHPLNWSELFAKSFAEILLFIKNLDENNSIFKTFKQSYTEPLLLQLDYLWKVYKNEQSASRPKSIICLPEQMRTVEDWLTISKLVNNKQRYDIYRIQKLRIDTLLHNYISDADTLTKVLRSLPNEGFRDFLIKYENLIYSIIKEIHNFIKVIKLLKTQQRSEIYKAFKNIFFEVFKSYDNLFWILQQNLNLEQSKEVIQLFKKTKGKYLEKVLISYILQNINSAQCVIFCIEFKLSIIIYNFDLKGYLHRLNSEQRLRIYAEFKNYFHDGIKNPKDFRDTLEFFDEEQRRELYNAFKSNFLQIVKTSDDYGFVSEFLNQEQRAEVYGMFKENHSQFVKEECDYNNTPNLSDIKEKSEPLPGSKRSLLTKEDEACLEIKSTKSILVQDCITYLLRSFFRIFHLAYRISICGNFKDDYSNVLAQKIVGRDNFFSYSANYQQLESELQSESPKINIQK